MTEPVIRARACGFLYAAEDLDGIDLPEWSKAGAWICVTTLPNPRLKQWTVSEFERMIAGERE